MVHMDAFWDMSMRLFSPLMLLVVTVLLLPQVACAHASPEAEDPKVGSTVTVPPQHVSIQFDVPIESTFSRLDVMDGHGQSEDDGAPQVNVETRTLTVHLKPLTPGEYTVKWS